MRRVLILVATTLALANVPGIAQARWSANGSARGYSQADVMPDGPDAAVSLSNRNAAVSWSAVQFADATNVQGYTVRRYDAGTGTPQSIGAGCAGTIATLSCTENAVPAGSWYYTVATKQQNWSGTDGAQSAIITIDPPSLVFSTSTSITTLPKVMSGTIATFLSGETLTWRLDDPNTGTLLTGTTGPVPGSGTMAITVTIPVGTTDGTHTVYVKGSAGSVASELIAVNTTDTAAPVVTATVIAKTAGGTTGYIHQGGTYYVYANANDPGSPSSGVAQVRANVSAITTGSTSVSLIAGSYTIGGVTYGWRSASLSANGTLGAGSKSYTAWAIDAAANTGATLSGSVSVDNTAPAASNIQTTNVNGGTIGEAETGDTIAFTFTEPVEPTSVLAGWSGSATNVTVQLVQHNGSGGDRMQISNAANTSTLPLGTVQLGRTDYTTATVPFTASSMALSGSTITITLGTPSGAVTTAVGTGTVKWTPTATVTDLAGNACSTTALGKAGVTAF